MKRVLIVWTSTTGATEQMVQAAVRGARAALEEPSGVELRVLHADDATADDLLAAHAAVFATPEHLGSMAGPMKTFMDRAYYPCLDRVNGRACALMICAGTDGQGTIRQLQRILTGLRMRMVAPPLLILTHAHRPEDILAPKRLGAEQLRQCEELGATIAAGVAAGMF